MIKSLIYKEWLKSRFVILCMAILLFGFTAYDFLALSKNAELGGYGFLWEYAVSKNSILVDNLIHLPVVCGVLLALAQFVPESYRKCLKLTLHLPLSQSVTVTVMQGYGVCVLVLLFALQSLSLLLFLGHYIVIDVVWRILFSMLTWFCAGVCAYLWTSALCLEPSWKMKVIEVVLMGAVLSSFYLSSAQMAYRSGILPMFVVTTLLASLLIHYSVRRFKDGVQ